MPIGCPKYVGPTASLCNHCDQVLVYVCAFLIISYNNGMICCCRGSEYQLWLSGPSDRHRKCNLPASSVCDPCPDHLSTIRVCTMRQPADISAEAAIRTGCLQHDIGANPRSSAQISRQQADSAPPSPLTHPLPLTRSQTSQHRGFTSIYINRVPPFFLDLSAKGFGLGNAQCPLPHTPRASLSIRRALC